MLNILYRWLKPLIFMVDPEVAHERMLRTIRVLYTWSFFRKMITCFCKYEHPLLETSVLGYLFPNPVGLAAGFDKEGQIVEALFDLGFGSVEIGTVTPRPQPGNPKPRIFRLVQDQAVINRMGFNNQGVEALVTALETQPSAHQILGINIGKNKDTPVEKAIDDYEYSLRKVYPYAHYIVINISSPNTKNLRDLQQETALKKLLAHLLQVRNDLAEHSRKKIPLLLKIAPDLTAEGLQNIIAVIQKHPVDGVIATNTTIEREHLRSSTHTQETGGLSGKPLKDKSTEIIRTLYRELQGSIPIIGVGGVFNGKDAYEKFCAGASLVQVYTGLIYQGPGVVKQIKKEIVALMLQENITALSELTGRDANLSHFSENKIQTKT
ncbi:quinone-dependent dihydroorotate dehydrogenase [Deltaproteobacteria bacterium TL4]